MVGGLRKPGILELEQMFDNVPAKCPRRAEIAASQVLDLLGDVLDVELVIPHVQAT
jgi:hypothetical protein